MSEGNSVTKNDHTLHWVPEVEFLFCLQMSKEMRRANKVPSLEQFWTPLPRLGCDWEAFHVRPEHGRRESESPDAWIRQRIVLLLSVARRIEFHPPLQVRQRRLHEITPVSEGRDSNSSNEEFTCSKLSTMCLRPNESWFILGCSSATTASGSRSQFPTCVFCSHNSDLERSLEFGEMSYKHQILLTDDDSEELQHLKSQYVTSDSFFRHKGKLVLLLIVLILGILCFCHHIIIIEF